MDKTARADKTAGEEEPEGVIPASQREEGGVIGGGGQMVAMPSSQAIQVIQLVKPMNVVTCPKSSDCDHLVLQANIFNNEQLVELVKKCKKERASIKTVLVNVRASKSVAELCSIVALFKQCANEKAFTGVVLLPEGSTGDIMKLQLVNLLKEFGTVTCIAVVKTSPVEILEHQALDLDPGPGERPMGTHSSPLTSIIQWAVAVRFDADGGNRLLVPKNTVDVLMFPPLSTQLKYKHQQGALTSTSKGTDTAILDPDQLSPTLLAYIWYQNFAFFRFFNTYVVGGCLPHRCPLCWPSMLVG